MFAHFHKKTYRKGEVGYYSPHARATVDVYFDSKRYVYQAPRPADRKEFKEFIKEVFTQDMNHDKRLTGRYPVYNVEYIN